MYGFLIGSLAYLCGALLNKDGILLVGVALISFTLQRAVQAGEMPPGPRCLPTDCRPFSRLETLSSLWLAERAATSGDIALVLLYALGMLVAALVIIRRAPLAR